MHLVTMLTNNAHHITTRQLFDLDVELEAEDTGS